MPLYKGRGKTVNQKFRWIFIAIVALGLLVIYQGQLPVKASSPVMTDRRLVADNLFDVDFADTENGLATGYYGTILKTTDGGNHWVSIDTGSRELIRRLDMVSVNEAWAVGHRGSIFHTTDGGLTWQVQMQEKGIFLRDISFASARAGWAVGQNMTILHTTDGGATWQKQKLSGYKGRDLPRLGGVTALSETTAVLVGEFGVVGLTTDGGANWTLLPSGVSNTLTAVSHRGSDVVAIGLDGVALDISLEGDPKITRISTGVKQHLFGISFNKLGQGIIVGRTVLLKLDGDTVSPIPADDSVVLPYRWYYGVKILPDGKVVAVGVRGTIIKAMSMDGPFRLVASIGNPKTVSYAGDLRKEVE